MDDANLTPQEREMVRDFDAYASFWVRPSYHASSCSPNSTR
jgi:hypothetical protein